MNNYYEIVRNDPTIINIYNEIKENEERANARAYHNYTHVTNVANMVKQMLQALKYDESFIDEAQVAAILHDTGCTKGKEEHEIRSFEFAKEYLEKNNINLKNRDKVLEAIKNHRNCFDTDNIITLTLVLADKLDIKKTRLTAEGRKVIGNRQYQYIDDINLEIDKEELKVYFDCDEKINLPELEEYYFTEKVFKSIKSFSQKMHLQPEVFLNDEKWVAFYRNK